MQSQLLNNFQVDRYIRNGVISIRPEYSKEQFQITQYPLKPISFLQIEQDGCLKNVFSYKKDNSKFFLQPKKYYVVEIFEQIILPKDIVGRFIPASTIIEKGILLSVGKIEHPYGQKNEKIRFGLYNCLDFELEIDCNDRIAYIQFFQIHHNDETSYIQTKYDELIYDLRRADDDGPNYEIDNE